MRRELGATLIWFGGLAVLIALVLLVASIAFRFSDNTDLRYSSLSFGFWALALGVFGIPILAAGVKLWRSADRWGIRKTKVSESGSCQNCGAENRSGHPYCQGCGRALEWRQ